MHEEQSNAPVKAVRSNRQEAVFFQSGRKREIKAVLFRPITTTMPYRIGRLFGNATFGSVTPQNQAFY